MNFAVHFMDLIGFRHCSERICHMFEMHVFDFIFEVLDVYYTFKYKSFSIWVKYVMYAPMYVLSLTLFRTFVRTSY